VNLAGVRVGAGGAAPSGVEDLRRRNTGLVLTSLRQAGPATRTELARRTGLAKATVGTIVGGLGEAGLVSEAGPVTAGRGRPGRPVTLTGGHVLGLGVEVNVDYVATVTTDLSGRVRHEQTLPVPASRTALDEVVDAVAGRAAEIRATGDRLVGLAAAVPGLVSAGGSVVRWAPNLHWADLDLGRALRDAAGDVVCTVDNDANCAALAETSHGAARDVGSALYLTGTVGIGAGIVHDHRLVRGGAGFAGEVGHLPLGGTDALCGCGRRGCWEAAIGLRAMLDTVQMREGHTPWSTAQAVADRAGVDPRVAAGLAEVGARLGRGLATLVGVVDPEAVVLGGYFVPVAPWLVPAAEDAMRAHLTFAALHLPQIRLSPLDLRAAALGAAEQSLAGVLSGAVAAG
jgi:predicted NBD/HSP70 family sugar kinase